MNNWNRGGLIFNTSGKRAWSQTHAQTPIVQKKGDVWRIFYSTRSEGKSCIGYIDVEAGNPKNILALSDEPVLTKGSQGSFDDAGVMPTSIINANGYEYLYYVGWSERKTVPYHNSIGLAIRSKKANGDFEKLSGPIISSNLVDPYFQGTACVVRDQNQWRMWYMSCTEWCKNGEVYDPRYHIKYATSLDGIYWNRDGQIAIDYNDDMEGGIASASVLRQDDQYMMWYCTRNKFNYRNDPQNAYRIGYAISSDGTEWERRDFEFNVERDDWDSSMMCYPNVIAHEDIIYMFYNGNNFGKTGFGYLWSKVV